jgi:hypothetical protein
LAKQIHNRIKVLSVFDIGHVVHNSIAFKNSLDWI